MCSGRESGSEPDKSWNDCQNSFPEAQCSGRAARASRATSPQGKSAFSETRFGNGHNRDPILGRFSEGRIDSKTRGLIATRAGRDARRAVRVHPGVNPNKQQNGMRRALGQGRQGDRLPNEPAHLHFAGCSVGSPNLSCLFVFIRG